MPPQYSRKLFFILAHYSGRFSESINVDHKQSLLFYIIFVFTMMFSTSTRCTVYGGMSGRLRLTLSLNWLRLVIWKASSRESVQESSGSWKEGARVEITSH